MTAKYAANQKIVSGKYRVVPVEKLPYAFAPGIAAEHPGCEMCTWAYCHDSGLFRLKYANAWCPDHPPWVCANPGKASSLIGSPGRMFH